MPLPQEGCSSQRFSLESRNASCIRFWRFELDTPANGFDMNCSRDGEWPVLAVDGHRVVMVLVKI